ncbi:hypothetical protein M6B38_393100 [Iris pallida]|uniref:Uncharacterized protein n=1 Tax=Iris pallida TaxID=29817 RepID=A0AAX6FY64_IRIPA|nr:hypothetical protein M6B38_393100 [Iris pallida]
MIIRLYLKCFRNMFSLLLFLSFKKNFKIFLIINCFVLLASHYLT